MQANLLKPGPDKRTTNTLLYILLIMFKRNHTVKIDH